jgi:hypothetical protein
MTYELRIEENDIILLEDNVDTEGYLLHEA